MTIKLPQRTLPSDIDRVISILGPKVMGLQVNEARQIDAGLFTDITLHSCYFVGLVEEIDGRIRVTPAGREYYKSGDDNEKQNILRERLRQIPIYDRTLEYFYHNNNFSPTRVDVAAYWHENFANDLDEINEEELNDAALFFLRFIEHAGMGQFVRAGRGRETHIRINQVSLAEYITSAMPTPETIKKLEAEVAKDAGAEASKNEAPISTPISAGEGLSSSNIRALQKLHLELTEQELDSPGARKLILDMLDRSERENTVLKAKVDSYKEVEKNAAILETEVRSLERLNLLRTTVNSIGGVILGMSLSLTQDIQRYIAIALGAALILLSVFLRDQARKESEE